MMNERSIKVATQMANAKCASAKLIHQIENGDFVPYWLPRLGGLNVSHPDGTGKYKERADAVDAARAMRIRAKQLLANRTPV